MLKRIVWKENDLVNIRLKENLFTIGQLLRAPYILFFKLSNENGEWNGVDLDRVPELFSVSVARDFLQKTVTGKIKNGVKPKSDAAVPALWIKPKLWFGGGLPWKGGDLIKVDPAVGVTGSDEIVKKDIQPSDKEILDKYELTNMWSYGDLAERLIRFYETGQ